MIQSSFHTRIQYEALLFTLDCVTFLRGCERYRMGCAYTTSEWRNPSEALGFCVNQSCSGVWFCFNKSHVRILFEYIMANPVAVRAKCKQSPFRPLELKRQCRDNTIILYIKLIRQHLLC